jgi:hypothetical protein
VINKIKCKIKGHDEKWERIHHGELRRYFVSIGYCKRCDEQWWLKGEIGHMRGVRFVMSNKEPQVER